MSPLAETLVRVAQGMADACAPWWLIGSAAVALHGAETSVADIDVLCAEADARMVLMSLGGRVQPDGDDALFRSAVFGRCDTTTLPIEVMAGLRVRGEPVRLVTREWIACGPISVPVPSRAELIALLRRFGREKDLARAALLDPVGDLTPRGARSP